MIINEIMSGGGRDKTCFPLPSSFHLTHIVWTLQKSPQSVHLDLSALAKVLQIMACVTLVICQGIGSNLDKPR